MYVCVGISDTRIALDLRIVGDIDIYKLLQIVAYNRRGSAFIADRTDTMKLLLLVHVFWERSFAFRVSEPCNNFTRVHTYNYTLSFLIHDGIRETTLINVITDNPSFQSYRKPKPSSRNGAPF